MFSLVDLMSLCVSIDFPYKNPSLQRSLPPVETLENRETKGALAAVCTPTVKSVSRTTNTKPSLLDYNVFFLTPFALRNA